MNSSTKILLVPVFVLFLLFPFFEGGETSSGLFYFHTITLLALAVSALLHSRLWIPRFLIYFSPFLFVLVISTIIVDYKYAAFLKLWDYIMGGVWAILICTLIRENKKHWESSWSWIFCIGAIGSIAAIAIYNHARFGRIHASFLNPNEYAVYALMLLCFGVFCLEQETGRWRKILVTTLSIVLLLSIGLSRSRGILVASLAVAFVSFLRHKPGKIIKIVLILLVVVSAALVAIRAKYFDDPLQYYRWKIWKSSLKGVSSDPYLGIGLGMLEYRSRSFNFPSDGELGRYGRIPKSADSQFVQLLAETGFLGLFSFLFGWIALFLTLRKSPMRYFYPKQAWMIITIVSVFSLPLANTSVLYLFLFLVILSISALEQETLCLSFQSAGRILIPVGCFLLFVLGCYLPFQAHQEFSRAVHSKNLTEADQHLANAVRYNPYQPYYRFFFIRKIVDARPQWDTGRWLNVVSIIERSIELNPVEYEFYLYKARIFRMLLEKDTNLSFYSTAISSYQTALDYNQYNVFLRLEFGSFLFRLKRYNLAEAEIRKSLEAEPAYLNARLYLTEVVLSTKRLEEARKEYSLFLEYHRRYRNPVFARKSVYFRTLLDVNEKHRQRIEQLLKAG